MHNKLPLSTATTAFSFLTGGDWLFRGLLVLSLLAHVGFAVMSHLIPYEAAQFAMEDREQTIHVAFVEPQPLTEEPIPEPIAPEIKRPEPLPEPLVAPKVVQALTRQLPRRRTEQQFQPAPVAHRPLTSLTDSRAAPDHLRNPQPKYPLIALQRGWEGTTLLRIEVLANGTAGQIIILRSSGHRVLDEISVETVRQHWKFKPARLGGRAIDDWVEQEITFQITRS